MSALRKLMAGFVAFGAALPARADDVDPVVLTVGATTVRAADVARRLAQVPAFQLRTLGDGPDAIRRRFVETVLVPELLYSAEAERAALSKTPSAFSRTRDALRRALVDSIRADESKTPVTESEARAYYDAHADEYRKPERLRLSRILVEDEALARKIIADGKLIDGVSRWNQLARDHSVDAATRMRGGALGFVQSDGRTDVPQVAVDPALFAAAAKVRDGEVVPQPVREGTRFAAVWRRGTLPPVERPFAAERPRIEDILLRARVERVVEALLAELKKKELRDFDPSPLESFTLPAASGTPPPPTPSGPTPVSSADPVPRPTDRGLR